MTPESDPAVPPSPAVLQAEARSDLHGAIGWTVLGIAILIGSIRMDRLESQNINPYTVPGLLPGLLGIAMTLLGALLAWRSWRLGGARRLERDTAEAGPAMHGAAARRLALVIGL